LEGAPVEAHDDLTRVFKAALTNGDHDEEAIQKEGHVEENHEAGDERGPHAHRTEEVEGATATNRTCFQSISLDLRDRAMLASFGDRTRSTGGATPVRRRWARKTRNPEGHLPVALVPGAPAPALRQLLREPSDQCIIEVADLDARSRQPDPEVLGVRRGSSARGSIKKPAAGSQVTKSSRSGPLGPARSERIRLGRLK